MNFINKVKRFMAVLLCLPCVASACDDENYRQFDFWLGTWQVLQPDGALAGENTITRAFGDCVIHEQYHSINGYEGASFNIYDKTTQQWHQSWVDNTGLLLQLQGGLAGNSMVMWGEGIDQTGQRVQHRINWTPQENGTVVQHWEVSRDRGLSWQSLFKGIYHKKVGSDAPLKPQTPQPTTPQSQGPQS